MITEVASGLLFEKYENFEKQLFGIPVFSTVQDYQNYCDAIYVLWLVDFPVEPSPESMKEFYRSFYHCQRWGAAPNNSEIKLGVHLTAYCLSTIRLLKDKFLILQQDEFRKDDWCFNEYILGNGFPEVPLLYKYHAWRSSHWYGGAISIMINAHHETDNLDYKNYYLRMMEIVDSDLIDGRGLIRLQSPIVFAHLFNFLYNVKHRSDVGEVGGVAHLIWIYHYLGRKIKNCDRLLELVSKIISRRERFIESRPYCIDFDCLQILRVASQQLDVQEKYDPDFDEYGREIYSYLTLEASADPGFGLHKLPGALAAYFECQAHLSRGDGRDVIKSSAWL